MPKISSGAVKPRLPPAYNGIEVNFCRNPLCENYGQPEHSAAVVGRGHRRQKGAQKARYRLHGHTDERQGLLCGACGQITRVKSNFGIAEEYFRIAKYLLPDPGPACPDETCETKGGVLQNPAAYWIHGRSRAGSRRYRCKACRTTFSVGKSTLRHRKPHENREVFAALMNGVPIRRIMKTREISASTLYGKIDFLHVQCMRFVADRERQLSDMAMPDMRIATDRQDYHVNWPSKKERKPMRISAVGSADLASGYILAMNLTYDPDVDTLDAMQETLDMGQEAWAPQHRRHARLWLPTDHSVAKKRAGRLHRGALEAGADVEENIPKLYEIQARLAREELVEWHEGLPRKGSQVRQDYAAFAHFNLLAGLLYQAPRLTLYLDLDSDLRSAALGIFHARIRARTADAFFVRIAKEISIDTKRRLVGAIKRHLKRVRGRFSELPDDEIRQMLIIRRIERMRQIGGYGDRWMKHPIPTMSEPQKAVSCLTDYCDRTPAEIAPDYDRASLHAIDRFFMQIRRGISVAERPISTANTGRRVWYGKSAYNASTLVKLVQMYRVVFNYHELGRDKMTPAMRLGLAKGRMRLEDIIYH